MKNNARNANLILNHSPADKVSRIDGSGEDVAVFVGREALGVTRAFVTTRIADIFVANRNTATFDFNFLSWVAKTISRTG